MLTPPEARRLLWPFVGAQNGYPGMTSDPATQCPLFTGAIIHELRSETAVTKGAKRGRGKYSVKEPAELRGAPGRTRQAPVKQPPSLLHPAFKSESTPAVSNHRNGKCEERRAAIALPA